MSQQTGDILVENVMHSNLPSELETVDGEPQINETETNDTGEPTEETDVEPKDAWVDILGNGQLMKKVLKAGGGVNTRPDRGHDVTVSYTLTLDDGTLIEEQTNFTFTVGDADVIQGLDLCLPLLEVGEQAQLKVHPRFGYGRLGKKPHIPPEATLHYILTLNTAEISPDPETLSMEQRLSQGEKKRNKGNFWYSREDYSQAIQCYRRCIDLLDDEQTTFQGTEDEFKIALMERLKVYNNLAAAQIKMEAYEPALKSVENVLRLEPDNVKALFRKGKILGCNGQTEQAIVCLRKALQLEPETKIIHQELSRLIAREKGEVEKERNLYKRMLGSPKQQSQQQTTGQKSKSRLVSWSLLLGGIAATLISILAFKQYHAPV